MKGHCLSEGQKQLRVALVPPKGIRHNTVLCCVSQSNPSQLLSLLGCDLLVLSILLLVPKLKRALEEKELMPLYQPQHNSGVGAKRHPGLPVLMIFLSSKKGKTREKV